MLRKATLLRKGRFSANRRVVNIDFDNLYKNGILLPEVEKYFPRYIISPTILQYGWLKRIGLLMVQWFLKTMVNIFLKPRHSAGSLEQSEIDEIYTREADTYDRKHHLTTHGMDLVWRRMAGWFTETIARNSKDSIRIIDLCTGTGLTVKEIFSVLKEWAIDADITGLDYNAKMLTVARKNVPNDKIKFIQGDATELLKTFALNSTDAITQVFGIGGISEPLKVFEGILQILKPGGQFLMIDMHKPIPEQPGEWPLFLRWYRFPILEMTTYEEATLPIVLNRLWGWRDTTLCFYFLPLVAYKDESGKYWGFSVEMQEQESQKWWFGLPLIPIAKIIVKKIEIDEVTARTRRIILNSCFPSN